MKILLSIILGCLCFLQGKSQTSINDESVRYQQERMVFKQWDKNKFTPTSGFLGLNPYYWLTWGLMPSYKNNDLRPLGPNGPQTQRLAMVGTMNAVEESYRKEADTLRQSATSEIAANAGVFSAMDPLWLLYYSRQLSPVGNFSRAELLSSLPAKVRQKVIEEGLADWFESEINMLSERLEGAKTSNMDRGARILAYHRLLLEYRRLEATWAIRTASAAKTLKMVEGQQQLRSNGVVIEAWTPETDVSIAKSVLQTRKY